MIRTMRRRGARAGVSALAGLLMVLLASQSVLAAVSWTSAVNVSPTYSWNSGGQGLARTTTSTTSYLHTQYEYDNQEFIGIFYRRGNSSGSSWGTARRLNPTDEHAESGAIAASNPIVVVAFRTGNHLVDDYDPAAPRQVRVAVNTNHGSASAWRDLSTFEAPTRVGRPAVAVAGSWVYVVTTDADTGDIVLASSGDVVSPEWGWTAQTVATTTANAWTDGDGFEGWPVVAASGNTVMVAWVDSDAGTLLAKFSADNGVTWDAEATTLTTADIWSAAATAKGSRFAVSWAQPSGVKAKLFDGISWGSIRTVASFSSTGSYKTGYGTDIALAGSARVGVAWSACTRSDCSAGSTKGVNVRWRESTNNLSTWKDPVTIAKYSYGSSRRINDEPSVVMTSTPKRFVTYNTASSTYSTYRLVIEVGSGTP